MRIALITLLVTFELVGGFTQDDSNNDTELDLTKFSVQIDMLIDEYTALDIFSGVVLVADHGVPKYHRAFGLANRETNDLNTLSTKFDIGSMNKTFTKIVVLQLIEEGRLQLSDLLGEYISGFPIESANNITIEHLINHSSGYGDYYQGQEFFHLPVSEKTIAALVERICTLPLMFKPGTEREYSNSGYILLGAIIEKITGVGYHKNIQERIIDPLGMNQTYVFNKLEVPNRAIGYYKNMKGEIMDNLGYVELPNPDGGFQSTTLDILKFYQEYHYGSELLSYNTKMEDEFFSMIQQHSTTGGAIPHAGGFNGANTVNYEILRDHITIMVFANMDEPVAEQIGAGILAIIRGKTPKHPSLPAIQNVYETYMDKGINVVRDSFETLTTNFHPTDPKAIILNAVGYECLSNELVEKSLELFSLNTKLFPENPNVWDSLGEAYLANKDTENALACYKKALEIDPLFPSALIKVTELKGN